MWSTNIGCKNVKDLFQTIYRYEQLDFLRLAFKYGKNYENMNFVIEKMNTKFGFNITSHFGSAYELSKYIANQLIENNYDINKILNWTFYCMSLINNQITDRMDPITKKIKNSNSRLKQQIINRNGKYRMVNQLRHFFIKIGWLDDGWKFSDTLLISNIDKYEIKNSNIDYSFKV